MNLGKSDPRGTDGGIRGERSINCADPDGAEAARRRKHIDRHG